ncbi:MULTISPECIES: dephospho-CoA kinase [Bacillaceae]|jgi:dephospho-CoA kinase|uniref:Dephospho-CoA kinase n=1 Tax=Cytobacillus firmus TaxID=1399 RepID=A0AA46P159_CYTFI|nr:MULTISPECIES: dephospho-CoA kinase [Bacillaceae]KML45417.1 dephospho-CoA kinase [Cytobacillus firmus]MCS0654486.1 dephospho-CoA kinase [Cytobacillus firmus]MCU1805333.1 dephospho-CoA kinase [Cytobacillus firmus]URT70040.1 dephospho-CoA kinase [Cytobacillus firmus]UYG94316.1 dephospho-CoA kinase [Cytobacillus firmus]
MSLTVGLTGGIASGKSTVSSLLIKKGYTVIDADIEARLAVEKGEEAYQEILRHFGERVLLKDGSIDRAELGSIIFHNETERKALNSIVHPAVRKRMTAKKEQAISRKEQLIILDIPLLFESKLQYMCDKTLLVYADEDIQLQRLMQRNQLSEKEAMARIQSQMPLKDKKALADAVIDNNGTIEETEKQLWGIFKKWNAV